MKKAVIVFPALNERERLLKTLEQYVGYFGDRCQYLIIDNGSTDGTGQEVEKIFQKQSQVVVRFYAQPLGKGGAIYAGFDYALEEYEELELLGFSDADGAITPDQFENLIQAVETDGADLAISSRWASGGQIEKRQSIARVINGRVFNIFVNLLFGLGIRDTQCGAKLMRKEVYSRIKSDLTIKRFAFDIELLVLAKKHGFRIGEIPIRWHNVEGSTFSTWKSGFTAVGDVIRLKLTGRGLI